MENSGTYHFFFSNYGSATSCNPTSPKNSKWPTDEAVEFPTTVLQCNTRQARPPPHHAFIPRPPYTPPIPTHIHVPYYCAAVSPHVRKSKTVLDLDSTPLIPDSSTGFRIFLSVERGFPIPIVSRIPDSLSCIPDSTSKISRIQESTFPHMGRAVYG